MDPNSVPELTPELLAELYLAYQGNLAKPREITPETLDVAPNILGQIKSGIVAFLSSEEPDPYVPAKRPDHDKTLESLATELDQDALERLTWPIGEDELHATFLAKLTNARAYALQNWPSTNVEAGFGVEVTEPDTASMMEANAILAAANDPRKLITSLKMWAAEPIEVSAVQTVYPEIYDFIKKTLLEEIDKRRARKSYHMAWQKESQAKTVLQMPSGMTVGPRSGSVPPPTPKPTAVSRKTSAAPSQEATESQKIESK